MGIHVCGNTPGLGTGFQLHGNTLVLDALSHMCQPVSSWKTWQAGNTAAHIAMRVSAVSAQGTQSELAVQGQIGRGSGSDNQWPLPSNEFRGDQAMRLGRHGAGIVT